MRTFAPWLSVVTRGQVMRYHAVLTIAFLERETPHVLIGRADRLEGMLRLSLKNLTNLIKVSRWETFLMRSIDSQAMFAHSLLLADLAHNLQRRNGIRDAFDRAAPAHQALTSASSTLALEVRRPPTSGATPASFAPLRCLTMSPPARFTRLTSRHARRTCLCRPDPHASPCRPPLLILMTSSPRPSTRRPPRLALTRGSPPRSARIALSAVGAQRGSLGQDHQQTTRGGGRTGSAVGGADPRSIAEWVRGADARLVPRVCHNAPVTGDATHLARVSRLG